MDTVHLRTGIPEVIMEDVCKEDKKWMKKKIGKSTE